MSSFDRRSALLMLSGLGLTACGFTPAYGPQGGASRLSGQVELDAPKDRAAYLLNQRIDERLGHADQGRYALAVQISTREQGLGITSDGKTTRYHLIGEAAWALRDPITGTQLKAGKTENFTGYSTTGSTVATVAAEKDATRRLMTILADQIVDQLIAVAADLPA